MARRLRRTVVAGGVVHPAGTTETAALLKAIANPRAWEGESDPEPAPAAAPKKSTPRKKTTAKVETTTEGDTSEGNDSPSGSDGAGGDQAPEEPPRGGEGATEEAWRAYATGLGIEVPEGAGRDDIVALVDAR